MCAHESQCPSTGDIARAAARVVASHPEQGWSLLCNGIVFPAAAGCCCPTAAPQRHIRGPAQRAPGSAEKPVWQ
jgi:hypothetical protein